MLVSEGKGFKKGIRQFPTWEAYQWRLAMTALCSQTVCHFIPVAGSVATVEESNDIHTDLAWLPGNIGLDTV